jgi:hypothetical protein
MKKSQAILIVAIIAIIAGLMWLRSAGDRPPAPIIEGLPWQIEILPDGGSRVFGLELGRGTLDDARVRFGEDMKIGVVAARGEDGALEAYFDNVTAGVITGKMVLAASIDKSTLAGLRERGVRRKYMNDTTYRYILDPDDLPLALRAPIATITFIPAASIDAQTVLKRFGPPQERLRTDDEVEHFLYPDKGLALTLDGAGKDILQYVAPRDFARLREPLHTGGMRTAPNSH